MDESTCYDGARPELGIIHAWFFLNYNRNPHISVRHVIMFGGPRRSACSAKACLSISAVSGEP